jgi:thiol-disulfide isomerase/thioredoxin
MKSFKTVKGTDYSSWVLPIVSICFIFIGVMAFILMGKPYLEEFGNSESILEYYYMQSCPHCTTFTPMWEELGLRVKKEGINVSLKKYDLQAPENKEKVQKNKISGAPTIVLVKNGKSVEFKGSRSVESLLKFIKA